VKLFNVINNDIAAFARKQKTSPGTTLSMLLINNDDYYVAHTGDTRIYVTQKQPYGVHSVQLTRDHTWGAEKLREGALTQEEIMFHRKRNMLTGCLGIFEIPKVFTASGKIDGTGSAFLLCSDGLYKTIDNKTLMATALSENPAKAAEMLVHEAESGGTKDNASVVVVHTI
jgi:protein phosphatase